MSDAKPIDFGQVGAAMPRVFPTISLNRGDGLRWILIDAGGDEFDLPFPLWIVEGDGLQLTDCRVALAAPRRPKVDHNDLSTMVREVARSSPIYRREIQGW